MKLLPWFLLICVLSELCLGEKEPICRSEPNVAGDCKQQIKGYTYEVRTNRCKKFRVKACKVTGNIFRSKDACNAKCKDSRKPEENGLFGFWSQVWSQFLQMFSCFMNSARF
ncbi:kunitz-type serine protease inhibitor homolog beta-bungarotoxin BF B2 chain [Drosophila teissieri]|uniref:kunitz-type serine protease inhibitor homolog beta-bungarotoxin BF B2 chain n=1 Tax=Drosophila teissieri TaxID=7243 RepID=UPI001CBA55B2|nr:kunitz-type serine protease inhibitor homolog beta-bungarotoxin BF B2 chain [Drosophila teissieri]